MKLIKCIVLLATLLVSGCDSDPQRSQDITATEAVLSTVTNIRWSDGDSGEIDGSRFRLKDIDAPETAPVGSSFGGAECELERERGIQAREFAALLTQNALITITADFGPDRFDRAVIRLSADGIDTGEAGIAAGHYQSWLHDDNGNSLSPKPDWCRIR